MSHRAGNPFPYSPENPPGRDELLTHMYAVHGTYHPPTSDTIQPMARNISVFGERWPGGVPSFRPTIHWALGGLVESHGDHSWEDAPYAVVAPLGAIEDQLVNVFPHDTFTVGDIALSKSGVTLLAPQGANMTHLPETVAIHRYDAATSIRAAIDKYLAEQGGWQVRMRLGDVALGSSAQIEGHEINDSRFFSALFEQRPDVSYGNHVYSIHGNAFRFGGIDQCINAAISAYTNGGFSLKETAFNAAIATHNLDILERELHASGIAPEALEAFDAKAHEVRGWANVVNADIKLAKHGKSLAYIHKDLRERVWRLRHHPDQLKAFVHAHWSELKPARLGDAPSVHIAADKMACFSPDEVQAFFEEHSWLATGVQGPAFDALYAAKRLMIKGDAARAEGMEALLTESLKTLKVADRPRYSGLRAYVQEKLSDGLDRESLSLPNTLAIINLPAVKRLLKIKNREQPVTNFDDLLARHPKTAGYQAEELAFNEQEQLLLEFMRGVHWVRADLGKADLAPARDLSEAAYRRKNHELAIDYFRKQARALQRSIRSMDAEGFEDVPFGMPLNELQLLRRNYPNAETMWATFGLAEVFRARFPQDTLFWNSDQTMYSIFRQLRADRANPDKQKD